eukprot:COSAG02_NODE_1266_length_13539_cov_216.818824_2_plen_79_part_00
MRGGGRTSRELSPMMLPRMVATAAALLLAALAAADAAATKPNFVILFADVSEDIGLAAVCMKPCALVCAAAQAWVDCV